MPTKTVAKDMVAQRRSGSNPHYSMTEDQFSRLIGEPVRSVERYTIGAENDTSRVVLANGDVRIVQRITNRALAAHKIRLARLLPDRLAAVGLHAPHLFHASTAEPPYIVREYVAGQTGAALLATDKGAIALAEAMGAALPLLAQVRYAGLGLSTVWANPTRLAAQAARQLARRSQLVSAAHAAALRKTIGTIEWLFAGRPSTFAHGDFCPVNVLLRLATPSPEPRTPRDALVLIDFEFARCADPLFDAAWWSWVVRYHHEESWQVAFPILLAAAGIAADGLNLARMQAIQQLRLLEILDYYAALAPERGAQWAERLAATLATADEHR